jgi:hypothetical protein
MVVPHAEIILIAMVVVGATVVVHALLLVDVLQDVPLVHLQLDDLIANQTIHNALSGQIKVLKILI